MNTSSDRSALRVSTLAALTAGAALLLGACSTTSASLAPGEKSVSAAKLHAMMEKVALESTTGTSSTASVSAVGGGNLATNP